VVGTAKEQTRTVTSNVGETVRHQVNDQKSKAAQSLRSLSEEMASMSSERDDAFAGLMSEASTRVGTLGDAPLALVRMLRPDVFVKGADHDVEGLPEARLVRAFGGRVHVVPYLPDRSTTGVIAACSQMAV
jgi:bifunctional ADP-heptose synthase (sugar kinase/adenylyltransferase)